MKLSFPYHRQLTESCLTEWDSKKMLFSALMEGTDASESASIGPLRPAISFWAMLCA